MGVFLGTRHNISAQPQLIDAPPGSPPRVQTPPGPEWSAQARPAMVEGNGAKYSLLREGRASGSLLGGGSQCMGQPPGSGAGNSAARHGLQVRYQVVAVVCNSRLAVRGAAWRSRYGRWGLGRSVACLVRR